MHDYSGLVLELGVLVENMMVTLCWVQSNVEGLVKTLKFMEVAAGNMLAITNLAICINLALIVLVSSGCRWWTYLLRNFGSDQQGI